MRSLCSLPVLMLLTALARADDLTANQLLEKSSRAEACRARRWSHLAGGVSAAILISTSACGEQTAKVAAAGELACPESVASYCAKNQCDVDWETVERLLESCPPWHEEYAVGRDCGGYDTFEVVHTDWGNIEYYDRSGTLVAILYSANLSPPTCLAGPPLFVSPQTRCASFTIHGFCPPSTYADAGQ